MSNPLKRIIKKEPKYNYWETAPKKATRDGFGEAMLELARGKVDVVALTADLAASTKLTLLRSKFPDKFIQCGVAEQNMMGIAAGMCIVGKIPFVCSFAAFNPGRNWDQLRVSVCYSNHNVKVFGGHAGITVGKDGATHQALEDIAITRTLPNLTVIVPCDSLEMKRATIEAAKHKGPVYIRGGRAEVPQITTSRADFKIGKANVINEGKDVTIIACGIMVVEAIKASFELEAKNITCQVVNLHTIKPIDVKTIVNSAKKTRCVVTAEEHQVAGGMGSAVAEVLAKEFPVPIEMVGTKDTFGESGEPNDLLEKYGLTSKNIVKAAQKVLKRKKKK